MSRRDPVRLHERKHPSGPMDACWDCGRQKYVCSRKRKFVDETEAKIEALRINAERNYDPRITIYRCGWCNQIHLTSHPGGVTKKRWAQRAEKLRRKALIASLTAGEAGA